VLIYELFRQLWARLHPKSTVVSEHTCTYCKAVYKVTAKTYVLGEETIKTSTSISACRCDRE
jgi:hypothetical protein